MEVRDGKSKTRQEVKRSETTGLKRRQERGRMPSSVDLAPTSSWESPLVTHNVNSKQLVFRLRLKSTKIIQSSCLNANPV